MGLPQKKRASISPVDAPPPEKKRAWSRLKCRRNPRLKRPSWFSRKKRDLWLRI
ncbi:hypothetical protein AXF42_Ash003847 [Apostasia shenzhenica]|uniref:Uncharacterized protein n=1 Tax=Apostasia shenzhenica TaxID=1088818 RepID=A0A2I0AI42_9ASPA|nr:hypothetical protein AXF42_Ash003847 [Apostasia shenzhenica]